MGAHLSGEEFMRRWKAESQFLASLEHPNIPALLDSGVSESGHPYMVVDYVPGEPINEYCDRRKLAIEDRLRLFLDVCQAVQYAHRALVLHRDLKPSNILVTSDGVVKLLDFGTATGLAENGNATVTRAKMLTPRYASPEQLRGDRPGVAGDVFSLGVVLYELLTGAWPFGDPNSVLSELRRASGHASPADPASAITEAAAEARSVSVKRARHLLAGDLSAILFKSLDSDSAQRYATVAELSAEIDRYLQGMPVEAHLQTPWYRAGKFIRRRWALVVSAAIFILGLSSAALLAVHQAAVAREQARKALEEADKANRVTAFLRSMLNSAFLAGGPDTTVVQMLNAAEVNIAKSWSGDPLAEATLRSDLGASYVTLSQSERARAELQKAVVLFESLKRYADAADAWFVLGINEQGTDGRIRSASELYARALEDLDRAGADAPALLRYRATVFRAGVLISLYDLKDARSSLSQALDFASRERQIPISQLPPAWTHLGETFLEEGRYAEAEALFHKAIDADIHASDAWTGLARSSLLQGNPASAVEYARRNRDLALGENQDHLANAAETEVTYARYLAEAGQTSQAAALIARALPSIRRQYLRGFMLASHVESAARVFSLAGRWKEAADLAREAAAGCDVAQLPQIHPLRAAAMQDLGTSLVGLKDYSAAVPVLRDALTADRQLGPIYRGAAGRMEGLLAQMTGKR
jgi:tetratricopeptide (TPR) repeat protein